MAIFFCLRFQIPQPRGPGPSIYIPQEQGGPVIFPRHWVPFPSPPTTPGSVVEYSNQHPCGDDWIKLNFKLKLKLHCDRRSVAHFILMSGPILGPFWFVGSRFLLIFLIYEPPLHAIQTWIFKSVKRCTLIEIFRLKFCHGERSFFSP
jgi:hypothetical protein